MDEPIMQHFAYAHLPQHLQDVSRPFGELAERMVQTLPRNPERSAGLRKLLEAKDCAVRALLQKTDGGGQPEKTTSILGDSRVQKAKGVRE